VADSEWWKSGVIYQIYPRSFQDSDGDGVGDLRGIEQRLDHLTTLGVDAIWISPIFPSPMKDFGYDVSDYCDIDPLFGTLDDFDRLLAAAHARGLRVLLDFVPSHTSDQHPWFAESRASRDNPQRDWYVWADPAPDGGPPNNWISEFAGPAWTFDARTGQYYLNIFLPEQPALNWRNPDVRAAMLDVLRFWFDRGVDGFRVDAVENMITDAELRDNPPNPKWKPHEGPARSLLGTYTKHQPEIPAYVEAMRAVAREYPEEKLLVGEAYGELDEFIAYYGKDLNGFQLPFNFLLLGAPWNAARLGRMIDAYEAALPPGAWPNWVIGNHDRPRLASRIGPAQARVAAMLLLTLRGTPTIYQGEEIGMENVAIPPDMVADPWEKNVPGKGLGRDQVRTPIPWQPGPGAGFSSGTPWLPVDGRPGLSVAEQAASPGSMLTLYRGLLALRCTEPALHLGTYRTLRARDGVLAYERTYQDQRLVVALNLTGRAKPCPWKGAVLLSTIETVGRDPAPLSPNEGRIIRPR
jgi:alpha-glucosidase